MEAEFSQIPITQKSTRVKIKIELSSDINITPFVARQKANVFLLTHLGNQLSAAEPKLSVSDKNIRWMIPIIFTVPKQFSKQVGELLMDVNSGEIILRESNPTTINEIENHVQQIYQTAFKDTSL